MYSAEEFFFVLALINLIANPVPVSFYINVPSSLSMCVMIYSAKMYVSPMG